MLRQGLLHPVAAPSFLNLKGCRATSSSHLYPHLTFVNDPGHAFKYDPLPRPRPTLLTHIATVLLTLECQEGHCHLPHTPRPNFQPRPAPIASSSLSLIFFSFLQIYSSFGGLVLAAPSALNLSWLFLCLTSSHPAGLGFCVPLCPRLFSGLPAPPS